MSLNRDQQRPGLTVLNWTACRPNLLEELEKDPEISNVRV